MKLCLRQRIIPFLEEPWGEKKMKIDKFHSFHLWEKQKHIDELLLN